MTHAVLATVPGDTEPVIDAAKVVATVTGVVGGLATIAVVLGFITEDQAQDIARGVGAVLTAATALIGSILPIIKGFQARAKVTPLVAPRDNEGHALVPAL